MEEEIFIVVYESPCVMGCGDKEIRLCKAPSKAVAETIAKAHGKKFFPNWAISITPAVWSDDDTAFVSFIYN